MARSFPNPEPHPAIKDEERAGMVRRLHCRTYSHCLSVCDREGWESFHCNHCKAFRPIGAEQGLIDAARLVEMVAEAHARVTLKNKAYGYYTTRKGV